MKNLQKNQQRKKYEEHMHIQQTEKKQQQIPNTKKCCDTVCFLYTCTLSAYSLYLETRVMFAVITKY